jgi:Ras-related GTP-binding protein C/D
MFCKSATNRSSFIDFDLWDTPSLDIHELDQSIFKHCGALVFVVDAQDDFLDALSLLYASVTMAHKLNSSISFEVFIHKVDGLSDDHKIEIQHEIHQRLNDEILDAGLDIHLSFHLTSIYDHSIFEAFSKVIQKLIKELPVMESL